MAANAIAQNDSDSIAEVMAEVKTQLTAGHERRAQQDGKVLIIEEDFSPKLAIRPENFYQKEKGEVHLMALLLSNL